MGKTSLAFFQDVEENLWSAATQKEYCRILSFENRDLQIRERKRDSFLLFESLLNGELIPGSREHTSARDNFLSFLSIQREQVEAELQKGQPGGVYVHPRLIDQIERNDRKKMAQDLNSQGTVSFTQLKEFSLDGPVLW